MLNVYTKINGKIAKYEADTSDIEVAWNMVNRELGKKHDKAIMVVVEKVANSGPVTYRSDPSWDRA